MNNPRPEGNLIIPPQLQRARGLLQLTLDEVASELNVNPQDIIDWEEGRLQPKLKQLEKLAELYGREIDYFLRETPPPPANMEFRGKPGLLLTDLTKETRIVLAKFDELCRTAFEIEKLLGKKYACEQLKHHSQRSHKGNRATKKKQITRSMQSEKEIFYSRTLAICD